MTNHIEYESKQDRSEEYQYLDLLVDILNNGVEKSDRTGTGIKEIFGAQMHFDLSKSFPLLTTKKVFLKGIIHELLWLLSGDTNIKYLVDNGVHIWDEWADKKGDLGRVYGAQWRSWLSCGWGPIDQIEQVIKDIKTNPNSRRMIVSAWNVAELNHMALVPCHMMFQFNVQNDHLNCMMFQRSADMFLGIPFNIASYSLLTCMIAQVCGLKPGKFVHSLGSAHIYLNHIEQVKEQLKRVPHPFPKMELNKNVINIDDFKFEDFVLKDYNPHPAIKGAVSV